MDMVETQQRWSVRVTSPQCSAWRLFQIATMKEAWCKRLMVLMNREY